MTHHYIFRIRRYVAHSANKVHVQLDECVASSEDEARVEMRERHGLWARMCLVHTQLCVDVDDDVALGKRAAKKRRSKDDD